MKDNRFLITTEVLTRIPASLDPLSAIPLLKLKFINRNFVDGDGLLLSWHVETLDGFEGKSKNLHSPSVLLLHEADEGAELCRRVVTNS